MFEVPKELRTVLYESTILIDESYLLFFRESMQRELAQIKEVLSKLSPSQQAFLLTSLAIEHGLLTRNSPRPRPTWEARTGDDRDLTTEQFVAKHYAAEKAVVTPRPQWNKDGPYGDRPADFIAKAYRPEMLAKTLHRGIIADKALVAKLASWLRSHPMPEGVDIPTRTEWNTRQLAAYEQIGEPLRPLHSEESRLHNVLRGRLYNVRKGQPGR